MKWVIIICSLAVTRFLGNDSYLLPFLVVVPIGVDIAGNMLRKKEIFSPSIFFSGYYILWMGGGYVVSFFNRSIGHHPNHAQVAFLILLAYLAWMVGLRLPRLRIFRSEGESKDPDPLSPEGSAYNRTMQICLIVLIIGVAGSAIFYMGGALKILAGGFIQETRVAMIYGRGYLYFLAKSINIVVPIYIGTKWYFRKKLDFLDVCLAVFSILLISLPFSRRPILWFVIMLVMLAHYLKKKISYRLALGCAALIFLLAVVMLQIRHPIRGFKESLVIESDVHVENIVLYLSKMEVIGHQGLSPFLMNLRLLLPGHQIDFGTWLKQKLGLTFSGGGISVTLIGEGIISGGLFGVILEAFLIGYILKLAYMRLSRHFSLRNLFIYLILLYEAAESINYGLAMVLVNTVYQIALVIIIIPPHTLRGREGYESIVSQ